MNTEILIGIIAAVLLVILVGRFVYQYFTTPGWSLLTAVDNSDHELWVFVGTVGSSIIAGAKPIIENVAYLAGYPGFADKITSALPQQWVGIVGIALFGLTAIAHKNEKSDS